jgi:hypothetical protein
MLHLKFCFHFVDVNISPPHTLMPLQNNNLWKVTHNTIHIENNFVGIESNEWKYFSGHVVDANGHKGTTYQN